MIKFCQSTICQMSGQRAYYKVEVQGSRTRYFCNVCYGRAKRFAEDCHLKLTATPLSGAA